MHVLAKGHPDWIAVLTKEDSVVLDKVLRNRDNRNPLGPNQKQAVLRRLKIDARFVRSTGHSNAVQAFASENSHLRPERFDHCLHEPNPKREESNQTFCFFAPRVTFRRPNVRTHSE